jgi:hypothetical protein
MRKLTHAVVLLGFASTLFAEPFEPFIGTWKLNSKKSIGTIPKDETVIIHRNGESLLVKVVIVTSGATTSTFSIRYTVPVKGGVGHLEEGPYSAATAVGGI